MLSFLSGLFDASFMPHGHCYQWRPEVLWLHAVSDGLIAIAYFVIPLLLVAFVAKRKDVEFGWMFMMFSAFIWLCGATHVMNIWTIWNGTYMISGSVKAVTGVVSIATAAALVPLVPRALALPSPRQLREINSQLSDQVEARRSAEEQLRDLNAELELRVAERSAELQETNRLLREEIAERIRTEDALRASEARFRQLADSMPQLVWSADPDGRVNYYNERRRELDGISSRSENDWQWAPVVHPDDLDATETAWQEAVASGRPYEIEHRARTVSGQYRWHLSRGVPVLGDDGEISQWYGSATDIHEQKEVQRKLREREAELRDLSRSLEHRVEDRTEELSRANQMLESRNQELQEFAYVASHDLKEPLRKIRTFAGLLEEEHGNSLPEEARMYVDRMQNAAERMMSLINDLLSLSRVSTQLTPFELVHIDELAHEAWTDLPVQPDWQLDVRLADIPPIEADEVRMRQLVHNLISNAIKYRSEDRPLRLRITASRQHEGTPHEAVTFTFLDNGIGFDPRYAERIFGAFQRLHGRDQYEGTGMGLAICRRIVDRHNGTITADSRPGEGAVFTVTLPVKQDRR
jgi:PAS domain S-box-containing protein